MIDAENPLGLYTLNERGEPVPCPDFIEHAIWMATTNRVVAREEVAPGVEVSTVFLGIGFPRGGRPPALWETLVFADAEPALHLRDRRYPTQAEAAAGHAQVVADVRHWLDTRPPGR